MRRVAVRSIAWLGLLGRFSLLSSSILFLCVPESLLEKLPPGRRQTLLIKLRMVASDGLDFRERLGRQEVTEKTMLLCGAKLLNPFSCAWIVGNLTRVKKSVRRFMYEHRCL